MWKARLVSRKNRIDSDTTAERRKFERHQVGETSCEDTSVWTSVDRCVLGSVVDQSDAGIGLWVDEAEPFQIGFQVRVQVGGSMRRTASVVYVRATEPNGYRLGLVWE